MSEEIKELPKSEDQYWEGERHIEKVRPIPICETHGKDWMDHVGYLDNHDGTASCKYCGWGFRVPGYLRIHEDKVFDLRKA